MTVKMSVFCRLLIWPNTETWGWRGCGQTCWGTVDEKYIVVRLQKGRVARLEIAQQFHL